MARHWGLCLPWFLCLLLTWADFCASMNAHWFSWEGNVITAAGCVHQVYWRVGSLGFCVISSATNVPCNAFFSRGWPWLSGLVISSAPSSALGSHMTSSVFILTAEAWEVSTVQSVPRSGVGGACTKSGWTRNWAQVFSAYGWNGVLDKTTSQAKKTRIQSGGVWDFCKMNRELYTCADLIFLALT